MTLTCHKKPVNFRFIHLKDVKDILFYSRKVKTDVFSGFLSMRFSVSACGAVCVLVSRGSHHFIFTSLNGKQELKCHFFQISAVHFNRM